MWPLALAMIVPALIPVLFLGGRIVGSSGTTWETLATARTAGLLLRSVVFTAAVTASAAAIGVAAAWLTKRSDVGGRRIWTVLVSLPLVIPSYVLALGFLSFGGPRGLFADLTGIGLPSVGGWVGAWLALTLSTYPYVFLVTRASLGAIDPAHEEAARSLGAGSWKAFRTVLVPQLRPGIAAGSLFVALYTLSDFGAVSLMGVDVFTRVIYAQYQGRLDRTPAAVLAVVLILLALVLVWAEQRSRGKAAYFSSRPKRRPAPVQLGGGRRIAAYSFLTTIVGLGVVMPVVILVLWLLRGLAVGQTIDMRWGAVAGSVAGSSGAAILAMVGAVPIVLLAVRYRSRASQWLHRSVYAIFSLPHITVALAVVFFASNHLGGLYQSFILLVVVYASLFLAQATGTGEASLLQVDPNLEDASRGLGRGPTATLRRITLPLMSKALLAGGVLVFLTTMKELPATLLLRPTGFDTLSVRIWSTTSELFYARAAAPALLLLLVSAVPMYLLVIRPRSDR
jgi:iron(III) transport system permease protein